MKIQYFSKARILSEETLSGFWKECINQDDVSDLDRAIMNTYDCRIFVRDLMPNEFNAEFVYKELLQGTVDEMEQIKREEAARTFSDNARIVFVLDKKIGLRMKDYLWIFVSAEDRFADVDDGYLNMMRYNVNKVCKHMGYQKF